FGISSYSLVDAVVPAQVDAIVERGVEIFGEHVRGKRFAVDAHRAGKHEFRAKVDLSTPQATAHVEIRQEHAYLFKGRERAQGGLPLGVEGHALALIS